MDRLLLATIKETASIGSVSEKRAVTRALLLSST